MGVFCPTKVFGNLIHLAFSSLAAGKPWSVFACSHLATLRVTLVPGKYFLENGIFGLSVAQSCPTMKNPYIWDIQFAEEYPPFSGRRVKIFKNCE